MGSKEVARLLKAAGWIEVVPKIFRNHRHYRHPASATRLTLPEQDDIPEMTLARIASVSGVSLASGQLAILEDK